MQEIHSLLRRAVLRMALTTFWCAFVVAAAIGVGSLIVLRLVQQWWPLEQALRWDIIAYGTAGGAILGALGWTLIKSPTRKAAALQVDEGAQLRESLSTALCVSNSDEPWARVVVESAMDKVRGVKLREAVPIQAPRFWPVPLALALTMLVVWMAVPQRSTSEAIAAAEEKTAKIEATAQSSEALTKVEEKVPAALKNDASLQEELKAEAEGMQSKSAEEIRLSAIKKLSAVNDRLEQLRDGEKGLKNDSMQDAMKQLRTPGQGPMQEVAKELAKGNFDKASEEMAKALQKMKSGQMSEEEMKKMAEQLKQLAEQLEKIAEDTKALEKELEQAGLDKALAKDPDALQKALENAKNLTEEQKQKLAKAAQAKKQSAQMCKNLSKCMNGMCNNMSEDGMSAEGMAMAQELAEQLSEMEMLSEEIKACEAAMGECQSQLASLASQCKSGQCDGMGEPKLARSGASKGGSGGGAGYGTQQGDPQEKAAFVAKAEKFKSQRTAGPIVGSSLVDGGQVRGESKAQLAEALERASESADDAIVENRVPREYQEAVRNVYGRLKKKLDEQKADQPAASTPETK